MKNNKVKFSISNPFKIIKDWKYFPTEGKVWFLFLVFLIASIFVYNLLKGEIW